MHELHASQFRSLLGPSCVDCRASERVCAQPKGLTNDGYLISGPLRHGRVPGTLISWPGCPHRWTILRRFGQELVGLADLAEILYDRGAHRAETAAAGLVRVVTEWMRCRDLVDLLKKNKAAKEAGA